MINSLSPFSFPLSEAAHIAATARSQAYPPDSDKAESVYLSTLAAHGSRYYLQLCSYAVEASAEQNLTADQQMSDEQTLDFIHLALSDGIAVEVEGYGSIGSVVVSSYSETVNIPFLLSHSPIGYLALSFDDALAEVSVLGFVAQTDQPSVPISEIQPLAEFSAYLSQMRPLTASVNRLSQWWNRSFHRGWTLISEMVSESEKSTGQIAFRSGTRASTDRLELSAGRSPDAPEPETPQDGIISQKRLTLTTTDEAGGMGEMSETFSLTLMIEKLARANAPIYIVARLSPDLGQPYLPEAVELIAADESSTVFSAIRSRGQSPFIDLRFSADPGDYFTLKVVLEGISIVESFVV